jgi:hypothetical protein
VLEGGVCGRRPVGVEELVEEGLVWLHVREEEAIEHLLAWGAQCEHSPAPQ